MPGHVRFVKNMLAGVGAVDVALLVVAANEGWMPQTEEHAQILNLLDIRHGMIAITKSSLVDDDTLELARLEIEERFSPDWPIVMVDSVAGIGIDEVAKTLDSVLAAAPPPADVARPRLWIDRVFAAKGSGTVVTGTLTGGALAREQEVIIEPGSRRARIRRIESHHDQLAVVEPGARVALNLAGIDHNDVRRGDAVVLPGQWALVSTVDVALRALPGRGFTRRTVVDVHAGSGEQRGHLRLLDEVGSFGRVHMELPVPLAPGDRLVLRSSGARATVGGATVLDVAPARRTTDALARLGRPLTERVFAARPWCTPDVFAMLAGRDANADDGVAVGGWLTTPLELERVRAQAAELGRDGWPAITVVAAACGVEVAQLRAAIGDLEPDSPLEDPAAGPLLDALDAAPFSPPPPSEIGAPPALVRALVRAGALVDLDGVVFTARAFEEARARIAGAVVQRGSLTVADARDLLGSSRKFVLPLLERMDGSGVTRRRGESRIPGPRAADFL